MPFLILLIFFYIIIIIIILCVLRMISMDLRSWRLEGLFTWLVYRFSNAMAAYPVPMLFGI